MGLRLTTCLVLLLLAACESAERAGTRPSADCLYTIEMEYGVMTKWDSCAHPPANAVRCLNCGGRQK